MYTVHCFENYGPYEQTPMLFIDNKVKVIIYVIPFYLNKLSVNFVIDPKKNVKFWRQTQLLYQFTVKHR